MTITISDIVVLAIFILTVLACTMRGLAMTVYSLFSVVAAVIAAYLLRPVVAGLLISGGAEKWFEDGIFAHLDAVRLEHFAGTSQGSVQQLADSIGLPGFAQKFLAGHVQNWQTTGAFEDVERQMASSISHFLVNVLAVVIIIVLVIILLLIVKWIIRLVTKAPVIKQVNRIGGFIIGLVLSYIVVCGLAMALNLFSAMPWYPAVYEDIRKSLFAKYFFDTNALLLILSKIGL